MPTLFTRIIEGELPGTFVWRDESCAVLMTINPIERGHALVVPVAEISHWIDCSRELSGHLFDVARTIGIAQQAAFGCTRIGLIVAGYEVPHTHLHVIPTNDMGGLSFANAQATVSRDDLESAAAQIRAHLPPAG